MILNIKITNEEQSYNFLKDLFKSSNKIIDSDYISKNLLRNKLISKEQQLKNYKEITIETTLEDGYCNIRYSKKGNLSITANRFYIIISDIKKQDSCFNEVRLEFEINKNDYYMFDISSKNKESDDPSENLFMSEVLSGNLSKETFEMINCISDNIIEDKKIKQALNEYNLFAKDIIKTILNKNDIKNKIIKQKR